MGGVGCCCGLVRRGQIGPWVTLGLEEELVLCSEKRQPGVATVGSK